VDTVTNLLASLEDRQQLQISAARMPGDLADRLGVAFPVLTFQNTVPDQLRVSSPETIGIGPLVRFIEEHGAEVIEARRLRPSLEDVFVKVAGIGLNDLHREKEKTGGEQ